MIKIESGSFAALVRSYKKSLNMLAVLQHICQENDVALSMLPDEVCELINLDPAEIEKRRLSGRLRFAEYYYKYLDQKGTQFIFSDLSTYKPDQWNIYSEIRRKLVEDHNIPEKQIKFIQEAGSDNARKELFSNMNAGRIRFLFGSTQKLGTGVNAQQRAVAIHHLDIP